jgi:aryl-alcohol dehydrogenase-like predicted oxidoreductase
VNSAWKAGRSATAVPAGVNAGANKLAKCHSIGASGANIRSQRSRLVYDTANFYTKGHSEKIIGDFIAQDRARRERMVLATKFFGNLYPGDPNGGGAGRKAILAQCEQSLRRLQTDYIDLYWLHMNDRFTPIEETLRGLDDLVASGKVRYIGVSDTPSWRVAQAQTIAHFRGWTPLVSLQIEYSLLERTVEGELIPMAQEMGLGVTPWGSTEERSPFREIYPGKRR